MSIKRLFRSIAFNISISIAFVVISTAATIGWLMLREERHVLEIELQKKGAYIADIISQQMVEHLLYEERYAIYSLLQSSMTAEKGIVVFGEVYGLKGEPIVKVYDEKLQPPLIDKAVLLGSQSITLRDNPAYQLYDISAPIVAKGFGIIGYLRLGITKKFLIETLNDVKRKLYLLSSIIVLIGLIAGLWMARRIIRPVLILNEGIKRIGMGELGAKLKIVGDGEIKELSIAFNEMSRKLKESIDALKAAQENLIRSEKLYALSEFSAGLAHEIKNPLTSIKMLMQTAKEKNYALCAEDINIIEGEINRIDRIVKDFLAFARPAKVEFVSTDINAILKEVITLIKPNIEQLHINLIEELDYSIPQIKAHSDSLRRAILNIVLNGIQAMKDGGTLTIASSMRDSMVSACIQDTGPGIPDEALKHIFNPFYTTKEDGTGMGLAIVYSIVREHGGTVEVDTVVNRGTAVSVLLPVEAAINT